MLARGRTVLEARIVIPCERASHVDAYRYFCPMHRKLSSVIIVLAYGLVLMPDLVHLPALVGHYLQHKERSPEIGVLDFLALHYVDKEHSESDDGTHDQLPFHHRHPAGDNLPTMVLMASMPEVHTPQFPLPAPAAHGDADPLAGHRYGLIQPPRC